MRAALLAAVLLFSILGVWLVWRTTDTGTGTRVIREEFVLPDTSVISGNEGRLAMRGAYEVPVDPGALVTVPHADLTMRSAYDVALREAALHIPDAELMFIRSFGAVTPEGKSSQWQAVFAGEEKEKAYEVVIRGSSIVSKKFVPSTGQVAAAGLSSWYDSDEAFSILRSMPLFAGATVSSIGLYYNPDSRSWGYAISTSEGTVSLPVR
jgi:muconolactone delta-isomerase